MTDNTPEPIDSSERIASRLANPGHIEALRRRYREVYVGPPDFDGPVPTLLDGDTWSFALANVCDAVSQLLLADTHSIGPADDEVHFDHGNVGRFARVLMEAAGLPDPDAELALLPLNDEDVADDEAMLAAATTAYPERSDEWRRMWIARMRAFVDAHED